MTGALVALLLANLVGGVVFLRKRPVAVAAFVLLGAVPWLLGSPGAALVLSALALSVLMAQPLYAVLGVVTLLCFEYLSLVTPDDYGIFPEKMFELTDKNVLLAIPFFVVSGNIMTQGGIAQALINLAKALTGWLPGGLAIAAVGGCVLFAAISGSSPVTVIAIGSMMYPALVKAGYGERPAMGLLTSAGSLGIVIPPSIPMIIYAIVVSGQQVVDVGDLFLAGVGPGLLIGLMLSALVVVQALRRSEDRARDIRRMLKGLAVVLVPLVGGSALGGALLGPIGYAVGPALLSTIAIAVAWKAFAEGFWALMLPALILGGIYSGFFTPTEAAAVAVVYSVVVAIYIYKRLTWRDLGPLVVESTVLMGALIVIMVIAFVFNDFLVEEQVPDKAVAWLTEHKMSRVTFLLALNLFLLVVGCFMDILSAILIIVPLIAPMATAPGIDVDPVHLGIIFIVNLEIGYLTPPLGLNLFVASTLFRKSLGEVVRSVVPYTLVMLVAVLGITYVPSISLGAGEWITSLSAPPEQEQPKQAPEPDAPGKVRSIEELMSDADEAGDGGQVKSIEELMREADVREDDPQDDAAQGIPQEPSRVKSIEELMQEADEREADPEDDVAQAAQQEPLRVKSIEELMKEADGAD